MHRGISLHMTSRNNKELLEDVVYSLWELETARRRQERLVLCVLADGDTEKEHETLKWQQKQLPDAPGGVMTVLQQHLSEMTMHSNTEGNLDHMSSSGSYEQSEIPSSLRQSRSSPSLSFYNHRGRSMDAYMQDWEGQRARHLHAFLPRSLSAPYSPLEGIAEGVEDAEDDDNGSLWSKGQTPNGEDVNEPDMAPIIHLNEDSGPIGIHCDHQGPTVEVDEGPTEEDIQQAMRVETYILGLLQRYSLNQTLSSTEVLGCAPDHWQELHSYPPDYCDQSENSEWQKWEIFSDENTLQDRYYLGNETDLFSQACKDPSSSINLSTIVADIDSHCIHHPCVSLPLTSESPKQDWKPTSLELAHQLPLGRLYQEERWSSVGQSHMKTTNQSRSEGSFQKQGFTSEPEHSYHTMGWDTDTHSFSEDYMSSQRPWSSTVDLSQEEKATLLRAEERLLRDTHLPFQISPYLCSKYTEQDHHIGNDSNARGTQGEGSDSSLSETCSPASSSKSSDSDDSGGLVWPQQVPPYVPSFSQNAPTAIVRIKASHALKRKILRFRSGSLKVMTTV
ncbi:uncharacterized protein LOC113652391 [Tachysurus fulvidraco]|uniref:uncharacterized protein LOC113652391 n=1 Tax=Tachysurus fulvidraco TaxID=1234273 RepID=UPI001FEF42BF|nr:uncharacterized protein LOC113652391 [Tachysurus fulvidraco]